MPPLTFQGPGSHTGLPIRQDESAGLTGGNPPGPTPTAVEVLDVWGNVQVLNKAPNLVTPMSTMTKTLLAGKNRFIVGMGMVVFPLATTNYNSFGMDFDGNPVTVNPLAPDTPSVFQNAGYNAHGFGFGIALGTSVADEGLKNLNVTIGRFGGAGNFNLSWSAYLFQYGDQTDAANLNNQYDTVLSLNAPPGAATMDSTVALGDLLFTCAACSAAIGPPAPFQVTSPGVPADWSFGTQWVDNRATMRLAYRSDIAGAPVSVLWNWAADAGNGAYGNQWRIRFSP